MKKLLFILFGLYAVACASQGLNIPLKKLLFETITIDDGLSQGMINWITQDYMGFIWIGTKDGLNRYDGSHFVVYRHDAKNDRSLADNFVAHIYEDGKHRLWVATGTKGLDLFDRSTETFTHFRHDEKNKYSINSDNVIDLREDLDGRLYIITNNGLSIVNTVKNKNGKDSIRFNLIGNYDYCKVFSARKGEVWISPRKDSLFTLSANDNEPIRKNISFVTAIYNKYPQFSRQVQSFVYDSVNRFIYMMLSHDLVRYDEKKNEWQKLISYTGNEDILAYCSILDNSGIIWLGDGSRIYLYDTKLHTISTLGSDDLHQAQMLGNAHCTFRDRSGNIWIGTRGYGVLKYNARAEKFHHIVSESVSGIVENNDGRAMILKQSYFVSLFDKVSGKFTASIPDTATQKFNSTYLLHGIQQDVAGNYWLAYDLYPLMHYNAVNKTFTLPLSENVNYFPLYKSPDKTVWTCSPDSIFCFDANAKKIAGYPLPVKNSNNYYYYLVQAICQQNDSIFWLGATSGLLKFNKQNNTWKHYQNDPADETSLSQDLIFSLCADPAQPQKYIWVGTNGGGLNRLDITTGKFNHYSVKDGLPNDVIYGILSDDDNNLWLSTNKGLSKFNSAKNSFQNYEAKDGLQSNEFNRYGYCKTKDGTLFFGGVNGFNYFNPRDLGRNNIAPNIVITDFKIGNKSVSINDEKKHLSKPIELAKKIVLNYSDNMISFDFAAMDFTQASKNLYQYKMDGFDKAWIASGTVHTATYTNLDPGTYTFRVKGSNSDGVWNEKGASLIVTILPPWYMTWWLRTLLAITVITLLYSFYRYRLQQALKLQAIRNKIASDLHDEIGSNLSSISIFTDVAKEQIADKPVSTLLNKISRYSQESMEAMSDIVWMINATNDRFENIIGRMRELAVELLEAKNTVLHLHIQERVNGVKLGMNERKNFWLIYKEALNNLAKYADAKNVWISLTSSHHTIVLTVKDDGKGFEKKELTTSNGLANMQQRAEALHGIFKISSSPGNGTNIELSFNV